MRRVLVSALAIIVALVAIIALAGRAYFRRSLPVIDGVVSVTGISAPVEIVRDADAIPHIFASTRLDALFGLGYVHAQDRLWQMEVQRRIVHGRLSEVFGASAIPQDRFLRTVGLGRASRAAWKSLPDGARNEVDAYVAGVNGFVATHHGSQLPPEFALLRFEPEPWSGVDVLAWVKMLAWDLSANYSLELLRHDLVRTVGERRMRQLTPPYAADGLSILGHGAFQVGAGQNVSPAPATSRLKGLDDNERPHSLASLGSRAVDSWFHALGRSLSQGEGLVTNVLLDGGRTEALGSNNWVVDGTLSATGKPLLANDPHLNGRIPSTWYLAHMSGGDFDVIGATLPGTPAVALGRNRFVAWGATNVAADVEDLYRERVDPSGSSAEFRGTQEPVTIVPETINVKGGRPVRFDVRITRHGPLVSDAINLNNAELRRGPKPPPLEPLAFRWTALDPDDTTIVSFLKLNQARNWTDFTSALRDFVVPSQNFVYADVQGHIGYLAPGRIPVRAHGDGALPVDGWSGEYEWIGRVPFEQLPHVIDPPEHFIVTANNRPAPSDYPFFLGLDWPEPYRAQRIVDLLRQYATTQGPSAHRFTPHDFARMQADTVSLHALALVPLLLAHAHPEGAADRQAFDLVRRWNGDATGDSAGAAIFEAWFLELAPALVGDELGRIVLDEYQGRFSFITRFVVNTLASPDSPWCDDVTTKGKHETCDEAVTNAFHKAVVVLSQRLGGQPSRWRWDAIHRAIFPHQGLGAVAVLRPLLSRSVANGGDWSTVNVGTVSAIQPYEQHSVASYRQIVDLSPANDSRFVDAVGETGHPLSRHYDDFLEDWHAVRYRRMRMERADVENGAIGRLRLLPR